MSFPQPEPADEAAHPVGDGQLWSESWYFDYFTERGDLGGYVRIGLYPNLDRVWYWACVVEPGADLVTVIDHDVPLPSAAGNLEIRHDGLWADHNCGTRLEHWNLGLESFGLGVDDPREVYGAGRGDRVPFGFELEWETDGLPYRYPPGIDRYEVPCRVHGMIQRADESIEFDGWGQRDHSWGPRDWWMFGWVWMAGRLDDGTRVHATSVRLAPEATFSTGYVQVGSDARRADDFEVSERATGDGLVADVRWELGGVEVEATPVAWAPILLEAPDGRRSHFARCLTRYEAADGRTGVGWMEFNQPVAGSG